MYEIFNEVSNVTVLVSPSEGTFAMHFIVLKHSFVYIPIFPQVRSFTFHNAIVKVPLEFAAIRLCYNALSVLLSFLEITRVPLSASRQKNTFAMLLVVSEFAEVLVAIRPNVLALTMSKTVDIVTFVNVTGYAGLLASATHLASLEGAFILVSGLRPEVGSLPMHYILAERSIVLVSVCPSVNPVPTLHTLRKLPRVDIT